LSCAFLWSGSTASALSHAAIAPSRSWR
jgi:hypothetical protein